MERTKRDYDFLYGESPRNGERALYNLGQDPRAIMRGLYKDLDVDGLALEFVKFEDLYDTNYQAYAWLYDTGYGLVIFRMIMDLLEKQGFEHTAGYSLNQAASNAIKHAKVIRKMHG